MVLFMDYDELTIMKNGSNIYSYIQSHHPFSFIRDQSEGLCRTLYGQLLSGHLVSGVVPVYFNFNGK